MSWPPFPKRLQSALKALCCLAENDGPMLSHEIAKYIEVPKAETAKILQLLAWSGFVTSRRGSNGGFQLATGAEHITMGDVIEFFMTRHAAEPEEDSRVIRVLRECIAPAEEAFGKLSLADITRLPTGKPPGSKPAATAKTRPRRRTRQQKNRP